MPPPPVAQGSPAPYLLSSFRLGDLDLKNRIVMAPMTRGRAGETRTANDLMVTYYTQRVGAGLIVSEGVAVSEQAYGWYHVSGIYTQQHAEGWKKVTDAVHEAGGVIFCQLWHMGRQSHSSYGVHPVAPSAIAVGHGLTNGADGKKHEYEVPRALELGEIPDVVGQYSRAAAFAKEAGFDGVEIHGANGYLIDTFLQSSTNQRTDAYGGSVENRYRLLGEVVDAVTSVWPANRVGVRISPNGVYGNMGSPDNHATFTFVASKLRPFGLAYLHVMDGLGFGFHGKDRVVTCYDIKREFQGTVISNVGYTRDTADGAIRSGAVDLVAFGRPFIANPDLPHRFAKSLPLAPEAPHTVYYHGEEAGYIDYPAATDGNDDNGNDVQK